MKVEVRVVNRSSSPNTFGVTGLWIGYESVVQEDLWFAIWTDSL